MKQKAKWFVSPGESILNIPGGDRSYYGGDPLPEDYEPPKSYIEQNIVVKKGGNK